MVHTNLLQQYFDILNRLKFYLTLSIFINFITFFYTLGNTDSIRIIKTPIEQKNYTSLTSYDEMISFLKYIDSTCDIISIDYLGLSVEGRPIPYLKISNTKFGADSSKVKVLMFAQQHGDEPAGKEAIIYLTREIYSRYYQNILKNVDLILIPQLNPDGAEAQRRQNSKNRDLNRNHLILTEPETQGLHKIFQKFKPEVTLDIHEYYPYGTSWIRFGAIKNFDIQFGILTNPNVDQNIIKYSNNTFLPFIEKYLNMHNLTFHNYIVGGPPDSSRIRHSTIDINDGRQSFGIHNTLSFILEGRNGKNIIDNIKHRTLSQYIALQGFLKFVCNNSQNILQLVTDARKKLIYSEVQDSIIIRMEHTRADTPLFLKLLSINSNSDTIITVYNYDSKIYPKLKVSKPKGYLIPSSDSILISFLKNHNINFIDYHPQKTDIIECYYISHIDTTIEEEQKLIYPNVSKFNLEIDDYKSYFLIPITQLSSIFIVLAFEPQSMVGLINYAEFRYLIHPNKIFPIKRLTNKF